MIGNRAVVFWAMLGMGLSACGSATPTESPTTTPAPVETAAVAPTETATLTPTDTPTPALVSAGDIALVIVEDDITYNLYLLDPTTMQTTRLTDSGSIGGPVWSPDGQTLAYIFAQPGIAGNIYDWYVYTVDLSGTIHLILHTQDYAVELRGWSADSSRLAVTIRDPETAEFANVWLLDPAREEAPPVPLAQDGAFYDLPAWSPVDASRLAVVSDREGSMAIYTADLGGPGPVFTRITGLVTQASLLLWSPDGTRLVFNQFESDSDMIGTDMLVDTTTGAVSQLIPGYTGGAHDPRWSPDGTRVAFWGFCGDDPGVGYACVYSLTESTLTPLLAVSGLVQLDWSPDGSSLLVSGAGMNYWDNDVVIIKADGSGEMLLEISAFSAVWQPLLP